GAAVDDDAAHPPIVRDVGGVHLVPAVLRHATPPYSHGRTSLSPAPAPDRYTSPIVRKALTGMARRGPQGGLGPGPRIFRQAIRCGQVLRTIPEVGQPVSLAGWAAIAWRACGRDEAALERAVLDLAVRDLAVRDLTVADGHG